MYEIAYSLGIPVYILENEMPYSEYLTWAQFFEERPVGWRDDIRAYYYLRTQGVKESPEKIFPSLRYLNESSQDVSSNEVVAKGFKSSYLFKKILSSKGGEKLNILGDI